MYKIKVSLKALQKIQLYTDNYRSFFEETYQDSWVCGEDVIIEWYIKESKSRYKEIKDTLKHKLEQSVISHPNNQAIIRWRSKILLVSFSTTQDTRIITDIEIR